MNDNAANMDLLMGVSLGISAELGRASMTLAEVLAIGSGSIVQLDRAAGLPIDVLINGRLVARGEIVAVDDRYGVRVTELVNRTGPRA